MKRFLILLWFVSLASFAQSNFTSGLLPKINLSKKLNSKLKWVNSIESREIVYKDDFQLTHSLVDIS